MSRLDIMTPSHAQTVIDGLYRDVERRIAASPPGLCPVDLAKSFLDLCHAQTCGKCVPCRIGLGQLSELMEQVLEGEATMETISIIERVARVIVNSADCAIGRDAARLVLDGVQGFRDDYEEHILRHRCLGGMREPVPCVALCPAGVDIPGYLVLIKYGRYADAVRLIRKDNPFPSACAYICEHPCEARCRRNMIDDAVNIRGLKRYAVDNAGYVPQPDCAEPTGKKVAVIGGGPSGLSAAYYLALMGHKVTVYEKRAKLGGMLRYGIPNYRLPREVLDAEIASMLALGIDVHVNVNVGDDVTFDELRQQNDALYIALGAHTDKKTGIEGEDAEGVISAVEMLREIGDDYMPDFRNKDIVVIGGGNVAMDVCRSAVRLGARKVSCVYRRRQEDMTALPEEVEGAVAEGVELVTLQAPVRIETDANGHAVALWTQPQIIGEMDKKGRPAPEKAKRSEKRIAADVVVVAIGQGVETHGFEQTKIAIKRGAFVAEASGQIDNMDGVFAGGDCVTGPATVIRAIAAGKVAAANIDEYLGFHHEIDPGVEIPTARLNNKPPHGRIDTTEREAGERKHDFKCIEPYCTNAAGQGPAWANSLFEDNAEFGLGMHVGVEKLRDRVQETMEKAIANCTKCSEELKAVMKEWIENRGSSAKSAEVTARLIPLLEACGCDYCKEILEHKDWLVKKSQWIIGGDGWGYDIGYGGVDHVLATGQDVNILVVDTEVYSNTGGQSSKSTPVGAVAKFASSGKRIRKKDLGAMAMTYGYVYVAQVSIGASQQQLFNVLKEAEAYPGPSLVIAYAPCINHGIKGGMTRTQTVGKEAVACGYWHLWHYNPLLEEQGKNPFVLDSKEPDWSKFREFLLKEVRYTSLQKSFPAEADELFAAAEENAKWRYNGYKRLAQMEY